MDHQDRITCVPSYAGLRLWPESITALFEQEPELHTMAHYTDKKRVLMNQSSVEGSYSLDSIYVLDVPAEVENDGVVTIVPLSSSEAIFEIIKHTFQLDVTDKQRLGQAFKRYEWLARSVSFFRLSYPRDHSFLPNVHTAILNNIGMIDHQSISS
jgi:hypothetical protein